MTEVTIELYGAFRDVVSAEPRVRLRIGDQSAHSIAEIKTALLRELTSAKFDVAALMSKSVLATERRVLKDDEIWAGEARLALLPPVCGG